MKKLSFLILGLILGVSFWALAAEKEEKPESPFEYNLRWYRNDFKWWSIWHDELSGNLGKDEARDKFNAGQVLNSINRLKKWVLPEKATLFDKYIDFYEKVKDAVGAGTLKRQKIKALQSELKGMEKEFIANFHYNKIKPQEWIMNEIVDKSIFEKMETKPVVTSSPAKSGYRYVAHRYGKVFHKLNCEVAEDIKEGDRLYYKTKRQALSTGRKPCRNCKP